MKKKTIIIIVAILIVIALIAGGLWVFLGGKGSGKAEDRVYVQKVSEITNWNLGANSSYSGVVESQETWEVKRDSSMEVKEVLVAVGDTVEVGTPLFTYNTEEAAHQIENLRLELEGLTNDINSCNAQIAELNAEKASAPADSQFEYTSRIQEKQNQIKQDQYDQKAKQAEIDKQQKIIDNSTVISKMAGVVKSIANTEEYYDSSTAFITILATGDYRVKGKVDEQSVYALSEGQAVIVRSRVDETVTWSGTIQKIDTETEAKDNNNNGYYYESNSGESATKYPFYITLDSTEGLMLGQHVFIEPDYGQAAVAEGLWLDAGYIEYDEDGSAYVWASNDKNKLEKRKVELGEMNEERYAYQILSGLSEDDYICYSMPGLYEGVKAVTSYEEIDYSSPLYNQEGDDLDDGMMDDSFNWDDSEIYDESFSVDDSEMMLRDADISTEMGEEAEVSE